MPKKPSRVELIQKAFPEFFDPLQRVSAGSTEGAREITVRCVEAMLVDMIQRHDKFFLKHGQGALTIPLVKEAEPQRFCSIEDLEEDRRLAETCQDYDTARFCTSMIQKLYHTDFEKHCAFIICDNSPPRLCLIDREYPAKSVQAVLEEYS